MKKLIEFDSAGLSDEEYAKLKAEMDTLADGLDCDFFDPEQESPSGDNGDKIRPVIINTNVREAEF